MMTRAILTLPGPAFPHFFYRLTFDAVPLVLGEFEVVAALDCLLEQRFRMGNLRVVLNEVPDGLLEFRTQFHSDGHAGSLFQFYADRPWLSSLRPTLRRAGPPAAPPPINPPGWLRRLSPN